MRVVLGLMHPLMTTHITGTWSPGPAIGSMVERGNEFRYDAHDCKTMGLGADTIRIFDSSSVLEIFKIDRLAAAGSE